MARQLIDAAIKKVPLLHDAEGESLAYDKIAVAQVWAGDIAGAKATVEKLPARWWRDSLWN